jgi:hypothetical protein
VNDFVQRLDEIGQVNGDADIREHQKRDWKALVMIIRLNYYS